MNQDARVADPAVDPQITVATPAFSFDNSFARELEGLYLRWQAEAAPSPSLLRFNRTLADALGLPGQALDSAVGAAIFSGTAVPAGAAPLAQAYAGHQFGGFSPQLGDGRALLLGEILDRQGQRRDIALKGSGRTPFSRRGDGKAALSPVLREYLIGEAMQALGVPTTRALAVTLTGEPVMRETVQPGAVLTRVAASHLRVGTFEFFAARGENDKLARLTRYSLQRHYPHLAQAANPALALLNAVAAAQARLIARWMQLGFIHGVMNTDNMTISGETIDYGPCAFMDVHDPATVFSSIDLHGRYAYGNQPRIAQWNLARLAQALLPLMGEDSQHAVDEAQSVVQAFMTDYENAWLDGMRAKIGLARAHADDRALIEDLLATMQAARADHTLTFRALAAAQQGDDADARAQFVDQGSWRRWLQRWQARLGDEPTTPAQRAQAMRAINPAIIPRNHLVEQALDAATRDEDMAPFDALLVAVTRPFDDPAPGSRFALPAPDGNPGYRTFCGT